MLINILKKNYKSLTRHELTDKLVALYVNINLEQQTTYCCWMKLTNIICGKKAIENCTTF